MYFINFMGVIYHPEYGSRLTCVNCWIFYPIPEGIWSESLTWHLFNIRIVQDPAKI
jgi:hypothetical protein